VLDGSDTELGSGQAGEGSAKGTDRGSGSGKDVNGVGLERLVCQLVLPFWPIQKTLTIVLIPIVDSVGFDDLSTLLKVESISIVVRARLEYLEFG
jgi:hypothetical protein